MRALLPFTFLILSASAYARIGETSFQCANRYGEPRDTSSTKVADKTVPLVEGAIHHTYLYQGWKIRAAFLRLDGPAVRMDFSKLANNESPLINKYELEAIRTVNTPLGMTWRRLGYRNPVSPIANLGKPGEASLAGMNVEQTWRRTDGALLSLPNEFIVRLELPIARQHEEQRKIRKSQQAQASVSKF